MKRGEFVIRDVRRKDKYSVDDEYLNGYAKLCGIYATGVYNALCRHADFHTQTCYPSVRTMADKLGISERSVSNALTVLEKYNIIIKERVRHPETARWKHNAYTLIDKTNWRPHAPSADGSHLHERTEPPAPDDKSHMHQVPTKVTQREGYTYKASEQSSLMSITGKNGKEVVKNTMINEVIASFQEINPAWGDWFKNKTQRAAAGWLVTEFGFDQTLKMVAALPRINAIKYAPTTTTPYELKNNYARIKAFAEKERSAKKAQVAFV